MDRQRNIYVAGNYIDEQHIESQILNANPQPQYNTTYNIQGDYVAGNKHVGAHIDNVSPGAIGAQTTKD